MKRRAAIGLAVCMGLSACGAHTAAAPRPAEPLAVAAPAPAPLRIASEPKTPPVQVAAARPKLDVVFVLDTTGSMAGLIDGAKQKIWTIADQLASAQPAPELRIGLIAYRDRGDAYVTERFALTDDIDAVYKALHALHADGGGDEPESVNQALFEAVHDTPWSQDTHTYRAVFLVGDAPPHMDYQDDVPYVRTVQEAKERGIIVNTVQCGTSESTRGIWAAIASEARGTYAAIEQDGGMQYIAAPMDEEIGRLNAELSATIVPYGGAAQKESTRDKARMAAEAPVAASASRHAFLAKKGGGVVTGGGDLVDDVSSGKVALSSLPAEQMPDELRALSPEERATALRAQREKRERIQAKLDTLVKEREAYVARENEKRAREGKKDGFDGEVMKAVKAQAASTAGVRY